MLDIEVLLYIHYHIHCTLLLSAFHLSAIMIFIAQL